MDARIAAYFESHADGVPLLLIGNSITLDRNFLREHLPLTFAKLHHRSVDLTSVELPFARRPGLDIDRVAPSTGHLAIDDVDACLATGRNIGDTIQAVLAAVDRS
ncbi:3'-5' exonuclease family protein [Pseudoclavibacter terrae]|uniref:Uncharacterized protein n=1 Tax=Pseudoclavibacter terrae TaxID=1530195 RepID=A0A7J5B3J6_9MICO|nr:hypothetical protein F8O03_09390 [Pseudoclavibacter terrae]